MTKNTETKLSQQERQIAARTGKLLAEKGGIAHMSEGDIFESVVLVAVAIGLTRKQIHPFQLWTYKSILAERPSDEQYLVDAFRKELADLKA